MTIEAQPTDTELNEICYPGGITINEICYPGGITIDEICYPDDGFDETGALDALATVVDDMVYLCCWGELESAHKVVKQMSLAQRYSATAAERAELLRGASVEFNRMSCENLRFLLARLVNYFVDTDEVNSVRQLFSLSDYFLDRLSAGKFRGAEIISLAESHERMAAAQLDRMVRGGSTDAQPFNIEGAEDHLAGRVDGVRAIYCTRQHIPGFIAWTWDSREESLKELDRRDYENLAYELAYDAKQNPDYRNEPYAALEAVFVAYLEKWRTELIEALEDLIEALEDTGNR